ncbi:MAG: hypothetical protein F6J98_11305 [Moorea sp. SIO4G2]|uniref:hypothetical protein n=1 Tax=Moorena TaxID=1155738 RepID=UPI00117CB5DF|nr:MULTISPECIES: hypothetical protein [unclassified Moorena]NEO13741.1 hypothetical protein [Moorena sp. SIO3E8]NEO25245.1 hypothetical protein [Moorena sp. SIO4A5]NEO60990.1 hypothetical protein [Moorena sp. SIO4G2]NEQ02006.1 hypothetical protein [Moorena sp. SIO3F7]
MPIPQVRPKAGEPGLGGAHLNTLKIIPLLSNAVQPTLHRTPKANNQTTFNQTTFNLQPSTFNFQPSI